LKVIEPELDWAASGAAKKAVQIVNAAADRAKVFNIGGPQKKRRWIGVLIVTWRLLRRSKAGQRHAARSAFVVVPRAMTGYTAMPTLAASSLRP
jgi:hypothetical protein